MKSRSLWPHLTHCWKNKVSLVDGGKSITSGSGSMDELMKMILGKIELDWFTGEYRGEVSK